MALAGALGWLGPLINISECSSYIGQYVQLIVFVHTTRPIQYKSSRGAFLRTDVQVGDDTRSYFGVAIWHKEMGSAVVPGDILLLQNVKIGKFGDTIEAGTVQFSSLIPLVHPYELLVSKGVDDLLLCCRVGKATKEKLKKVIEWVKQARVTLHGVQENTYQKRPVLKNWKQHGGRKCYDCVSVAEVSSLTISGDASFYALVGDILLPSIGESIEGFDMEKMFISKRILHVGDTAKDLVCLGCKLCGYPLNSESGSLLVEKRFPLYCQKSSNHRHIVSMIYRPFLLYVWDQSECIPLHVTNNAAELLFGNITAERVYSCYEKEKNDWNSYIKDGNAIGHCDQRVSALPEVVGMEVLDSEDASGRLQSEHTQQPIKKKKPNFYGIWLILLKLLLQQGKNSPLRFEVTVDISLNEENGKFALVSMTMPCTKSECH